MSCEKMPGYPAGCNSFVPSEPLIIESSNISVRCSYEILDGRSAFIERFAATCGSLVLFLLQQIGSTLRLFYFLCGSCTWRFSVARISFYIGKGFPGFKEHFKIQLHSSRRNASLYSQEQKVNARVEINKRASFNCFLQSKITASKNTKRSTDRSNTCSKRIKIREN